MGALSKAVTRVRDEILALRAERERFRCGLQLETKDRKRVVSGMLARFYKDLAEMAQRRRNVRLVFLLDLKRTVFRLRQETRDGVGRIREAFSSLGSAAPGSAARVRQNRQVASHVNCQDAPRVKPDEAEPGSSAGQARTKIERRRRRKGVRHQHRP